MSDTAARPSREQQGVSQSETWNTPGPRPPSAEARKLARRALWRGLLSLTVSALFVAAAAAILAVVLPDISRITLFAEFSLLAVALPGAMLSAHGYGDAHRRPALDPRASPPWMPERFWVVISALRDRAFRLHGWIAAAAIAACTFTAAERALSPALVATRAENLAPWLAAALALFAGVIVAITNETLTRRLRTSFRSGVTDYTATLMARFHGATGLLTLLIAALFFQGDADFLTRLAVATIAIPPLSWAATTGFCTVMLAWPLRAAHRGTLWLFVDTDARALVSETYSATGPTWSGGPVVVVCSPPDGTRGEHLIACALAGETGALRIESRADIDAWRRSQPEPEHWTANPRRQMFVEPALLDTVRERCVRKGDSIALLTVDGTLAQRWAHDEELMRNKVSIFAGDGEADFAAHVDHVYSLWSDTLSTPSAPPATAAKRSLRPLLCAQLFERFASFALYAHLLAAVTGATPQPGYNAETVFLIPLLYVVGLLIAGIWLSAGIDNVGYADAPIAATRERLLHDAVTGLLSSALGIATMLTLRSPLFDVGLVAAVTGIALYRCAITSLLVAAYDDPHDAPRRSRGFAALHVVGATGAVLGVTLGSELPLESPERIAVPTGLAIGASVLCLALAVLRAPLDGGPSLPHFLRATLFSRRNLLLAGFVGLLWLSGETMLGVLAVALLVASGAFVLANSESDDPRYASGYELTQLLAVLIAQFIFWVCVAQFDNGIGYIVRELAGQTPSQSSSWTDWQSGVLLVAFVLLSVLRWPFRVNYAAHFLAAGFALSALASLLTSGLDGVAAQRSLGIGHSLAATGQLLVAATGLTLLLDFARPKQRAFVIALWLTTPIIAAYVAPAFQSGRPTFGAPVTLVLTLIAWLVAYFAMSRLRNSSRSAADTARGASPAEPTGSRNTEPR